MELITGLPAMDIIALISFILIWIAFAIYADLGPGRARSISHLVNERRHHWMRVMTQRELRMVDTAILNGLQQSSAFFASTAIISIGGCFALLGAGAVVDKIYADLGWAGTPTAELWQFKILGLAILFGYCFFKFGWAYRLFAYSAIAVGATPMHSSQNQKALDRAADQAAALNILAGRHFNAGLRGYFFSIAYLGWFAGPWALICVSFFVVLVMSRRQFLSNARTILANRSDQD